MLISDSAYEAGVARLRAAAATEDGPVIGTLDLLVTKVGQRNGRTSAVPRTSEPVLSSAVTT